MKYRIMQTAHSLQKSTNLNLLNLQFSQSKAKQSKAKQSKDRKKAGEDKNRNTVMDANIDNEENDVQQ